MDTGSVQVLPPSVDFATWLWFTRFASRPELTWLLSTYTVPFASNCTLGSPHLGAAVPSGHATWVQVSPLSLE